jgi:hypothetical protein
LAGLEAFLPGVEVHRGHFGKVGFCHVDIETLGLANIGASGNGTIKEGTLWDFPNSLV